MRKALGKYDLATVQATSIDEESGMVRLSTVLAHSSGEWISSDWPVCPITETAAPRRMGAALTYARRYALFTLVGIAGEDDIDAPDLPASQDLPERSQPSTPGSKHGRTTSSKLDRPAPRPSKILGPTESADIRSRLVGEIEKLSSLEAAVAWARGTIEVKNSLTAVDARSVEEAFESKMRLMDPVDPGDAPSTHQCLARRAAKPIDASPGGVDKSVPRPDLPREDNARRPECGDRSSRS